MYIRMMEYFKFDSLLAKLVFLILAIVAVHYHIVLGVIVILLFISLTQNVIEGMEGSSEKNQDTSKDSNVQNFKQKNCVNGKLMKDNKEITPQQVKESFPNIKFTGDTCNPCDEDCQFEIISGEEQMTNEENLRPTDSNQINVDRNQAIKKK
jgi:hypothetical protein